MSDPIKKKIKERMEKNPPGHGVIHARNRRTGRTEVWYGVKGKNDEWVAERIAWKEE